MTMVMPGSGTTGLGARGQRRMQPNAVRPGVTGMPAAGAAGLRPNPAGGVPRTGAANGLPAGIDPAAVANDPEGYRRWMQQAQQQESQRPGSTMFAQPGQPASFRPNSADDVAPAGGMAMPGGPRIGGMSGGTFRPGPSRPDAPGTGGFSFARMSQINPASDLRGQMIAPGNSPRTTRFGGFLDRAAQDVADAEVPTFQQMDPFSSGAVDDMAGIGPVNINDVDLTDFSGANDLYGRAGSGLSSTMSRLSQLFGGGDPLSGVGGVSFDGTRAGSTLDSAESALNSSIVRNSDVGDARRMMMERLSALGGPDRGTLAAESYDQLVERSAPQFASMVSDLGKRTAAMGRRGAGMVNKEGADLGTARERELSLARRELATNAAQQTLADRLGVLDATRGTTESLAGMDFTDSGQRLQRGQALTGVADARRALARDATDAQATNASIGLQRASQMRGLANDEFGRSLSTAEFTRGTGDRLADQGTQRTRERTGNVERRFTADTANADRRERQADFRYNADRDRYGFARDERDGALSAAERGNDFRMRRASQMGDLYGQQRRFDAADRDELRGERGYQNDLRNQSVQDQINAILQGESWRSGNVGRATGAASTGFGNDPSSALFNAAGQAQGQADGAMGSIGQLLQALMMSQAMRGGAR
jgi:hypothetical protein